MQQFHRPSAVRAVAHAWTRIGGAIMARTSQVGYIGTVGRRSGRPRSVPIAFVRRPDGHLLVGAGASGRAWVANLRANPTCSFTIRGQARPYRARPLVGAEAATIRSEYRATHGGRQPVAGDLFELVPTEEVGADS